MTDNFELTPVGQRIYEAKQEQLKWLRCPYCQIQIYVKDPTKNISRCIKCGYLFDLLSMRIDVPVGCRGGICIPVRPMNVSPGRKYVESRVVEKNLLTGN